MNKGCLYMLFSPFIIGLALVLAMLCANLYVNLVQKQACFEYARQKGLADMDYLEFTDVTIATNQFHGHICNFTDTRTGYPISLRFAEEDIPYFADTMQVMSMVIPVLCFTVLGTALLEGVIRKIRQRRARNAFPSS